MPRSRIVELDLHFPICVFFAEVSEAFKPLSGLLKQEMA
jgi:hypothetical protein